MLVPIIKNLACGFYTLHRFTEPGILYIDESSPASSDEEDREGSYLSSAGPKKVGVQVTTAILLRGSLVRHPCACSQLRVPSLRAAAYSCGDQGAACGDEGATGEVMQTDGHVHRPLRPLLSMGRERNWAKKLSGVCRFRNICGPPRCHGGHLLRSVLAYLREIGNDTLPHVHAHISPTNNSAGTAAHTT